MGETRRLTLREAAEAAGMPLDAFRKRVYRGTIKAAKVDGQYLIDPDDLAALIEPGKTPSDIGETTGETVLGRVSDTGETPSQAPELTLDYIDSLKGEITFLRDQLDKRSQELAAERERSDVLHREAFARIEALTAGLVEIEQEFLPDSGRKSAESPQDTDDAPETTMAGDPSSESNAQARDERRSVFGDLWAWMRRR